MVNVLSLTAVIAMNVAFPKVPRNLHRMFQQVGAVPEADVPVDISYDIIRHVSAQLYTTPRKAIEELVCNAYDAGASECSVVLPKTASDSLIVLDNGKSMDLTGIFGLWQVAKSPKDKGQEPRVANNRMQIGKFGVGKLAAFALGERLTHVACKAEVVRIISVGKSEIKDKALNKAPTFKVFRLPLSKAKPLLVPWLKGATKPWEKGWRSWTLAMVEEIDPTGIGSALKAPTFKVFRLPLSKAKPLLVPWLKGATKPWEKGWRSWTLAMVEEIDPTGIGSALKIDLLKKMISTALPVSAQFKVSLQGDVIPARKIDPNKIVITVDVIDEKFRQKLEETLKDYWAEKLDISREDVPTKDHELKVKSVPKPEQTNKKTKALIVPSLGTVIGSAVYAKTSLTSEKRQERGYSDNGFSVTAYGKVVNPDDPLFGITQRSHKYWSKFLARVEIPGLDRVLLVQRNAVSETSPEAELAREVLRTLFNYTRNLVEEREETGEYDPGSFGARLASSAPILAQAGLRGLLGGPVAAGDLENIKIEFGDFGPAGPAARFDTSTREIIVNQEHPLITSLDDLGALSTQMRRVIGEVIAGIEVGKGYLSAQGVADEIVIATGEVIDASLRSAADFVRDPVEEHIEAIRNASFEGDTPFEKSVVEAFRALRLAAHHLGASDEPDGVIEIPLSGKENLRISVEAKGSRGIITHKDLSEATVRRHRGESKCQYAVAIAREFAKQGRLGKESALIRETKNRVPLLTVAAIERMLRLHKRRNFTYDKVATILTTWKHPNETLDFIQETWLAMPKRGLMRLILTAAHDIIESDATNLPDPGMICADVRVRAKRIKREDVATVLKTIELTTGMITITNPNDFRFELNAPVETILEAMQSNYESDLNETSGNEAITRKSNA